MVSRGKRGGGATELVMRRTAVLRPFTGTGSLEWARSTPKTVMRFAKNVAVLETVSWERSLRIRSTLSQPANEDLCLRLSLRKAP